MDKAEFKTVINESLVFISENKLEKALKELQRFKFGQKIDDSIILQLRQLEQIKEDFDYGFITQEEKSTRENKIAYSSLDLIRKIKLSIDKFYEICLKEYGDNDAKKVVINCKRQDRKSHDLVKGIDLYVDQEKVGDLFGYQSFSLNIKPGNYKFKAIAKYLYVFQGNIRGKDSYTEWRTIESELINIQIGNSGGVLTLGLDSERDSDSFMGRLMNWQKFNIYLAYNDKDV